MTVFLQSTGQLEPIIKKLTDTSDQTLFTANDAIQFYIESINAAAIGTSSFSLWVHDGSQNVHIVAAKSITAGDYITVSNHPMKFKPGWSLKCKASNTAGIDVTGTLALITKARPGQPTPIAQV